MKKKTQKAISFIEELHKHLTGSPLLRDESQGRDERQIQTEIRPIIFDYMKEYFKKKNRKNPVRVADEKFYWESQESEYKNLKIETFASKNYPDFIISYPYKIAIEYKKSKSGSVVKQGIGQSIMHTIGGEFDFVYCLIKDESPDKKIIESINNEKEKRIIKNIWKDFNVFIRFI